MKNTKWMLSAVLAVSGSAVQAYGIDPIARAAASTSEVSVNISSATIVSGYDPAEPTAVISGMFPNSCYSWNRATVNNVSDTLHEIRALANVRMGMCLMVLIPYSEEVQVGKLVPGTHTLRFMNGDGTYQEKKVVVDR